MQLCLSPFFPVSVVFFLYNAFNHGLALIGGWRRANHPTLQQCADVQSSPTYNQWDMPSGDDILLEGREKWKVVAKTPQCGTVSTYLYCLFSLATVICHGEFLLRVNVSYIQEMVAHSRCYFSVYLC